MDPSEALLSSSAAAPVPGVAHTPAAIDKAAQDFTSFFLQQSFETMFSSLGTDSLFGGGEGETIYRSLLLQEYSKVAAKSGGLGIGDAVRRQMLQMQEAKMTRTQPRAAPGTMASLAALANELAALLERETALVRALRIAEIEPLHPEKSRLTLRFEKELKATAASGEALARGPDATPWLAAGQRLAAAAMENERALRVGRAATERLVGAVVSAVKQSRPAAAGYSKGRSSPCAPISGVAVDHRL